MLIGIDGLVMIIGLLMYALCVNGKLAEIGRIMFAFGLLALLLGGDQIVKIFGR